METLTLTCSLCQESYPVEPYHQHLSSEVHLRYAKIASTYFCEICRSPASGEIPFKHHINGRQHEKAKIRLLQPSHRLNTGNSGVSFNTNNSTLPSTSFVSTKDGPYYVCECFALCNSRLDLERHREGPKCRRKMQTMGLWKKNQQVSTSEETNNVGVEITPCDIPTYCDICKTVIPEGDENRRVHENGQKHKKKKEQMEMEQFMSTYNFVAYPEQPELLRRNSQESELSEAMSSLSFVTARSELSSFGEKESTLPQTINSPPETLREINLTTSITKTSVEATQCSIASQNHMKKKGEIKKRQHKKGRGYCLIINQKTFPEGPRNGTNVDANLLKQTFENLNFEVRIEADLTAEDMLLKLQELCYYLNRNPKKYYLMCICFLSHGNKDVEQRHELIYGVDRGGIHIRDQIVFDIFNSENCPSMSEKPKLFISNACRGYKELPGIEVNVLLFHLTYLKKVI